MSASRRRGSRSIGQCQTLPLGLTTGADIDPLLFCMVWIVIGLVWIRVATSPTPGMVTITANAALTLLHAAVRGWPVAASRNIHGGDNPVLPATRGLTSTGN
jgi:hypothetical protein